MADYLKKKIKNIPELPGIYKMIDKDGRIIYIGKSISLKKRVMSYFTQGPKWGKIERMVELIEDIEHEVTDTHLEARLRECKLIKDLQPIFNSQYKNYKKYVYLKVEDYNIYNPLSISYEKEEKCFGPFRSQVFLRNIMDSLKNIYPIKKINNEYRFDYRIIPNEMEIEEFYENQKNLLEILSDEDKLTMFSNKLQDKMKESASLLKFERARYYKNLISSLNYIKKNLIDYKKMADRKIVLRLAIKDGYKLFYIQSARIILKEKYSNFDKKILDDFIKKGKSIRFAPEEMDERYYMDFRDILFSEIRSLDEEEIIIIS